MGAVLFHASLGLIAKVMENAQTARLAALLLAAVAASGPQYGGAPDGQARTLTFDPSLLESGALIRYRELERGDFRAMRPPTDVVGSRAHLGAATCVFLVSDPDLSISFISRGLDAEFGRFRTRIENLGFIAYMDRGCSWWNPEPVSLPADYILQHEQIHFALFEIAARRLGNRAAELKAELETVSTDQTQTARVIHARLDAELLRTMNEVTARGDEFDRDTSMSYRRARQSWWWGVVTAELERLEPSGRHP